MDKIFKKGDIVKYEDKDYVVTYVFNHGIGMVYYDLEEKVGSLWEGRKRVELSVHSSQIQNSNLERI